MLGVSLLTNASVLARIQGAGLTGGNAAALGGIADQFVFRVTHHQATDATNEPAREAGHAMDGSEVGHSADEERLQQIETEEAPRNGAGVRTLK